jgi:hypothetical protein
MTPIRAASPVRIGPMVLAFDPQTQKIGNADEVFANRDDQPQYVRVQIGIFWGRSVLIPVQFVETDEKRTTLVPK